ncbi:thioredoxin domain-containing protein 3 [Vombatus ursinus]|uniref:thioredoxin domain-containing protein 3 n=1 Tax=Vombatus ursinus TaxID=29139 RepID=UPI000FFDABE6|nr:thioredoxin domain-containing protein 3 [Vombatus ursinus]
MAGKKKEAQLQMLVNNETLWEEMLQNKGLTVIDVYQAWCGPCKAVQALFQRLKNDLSSDEELLHFVVAEADNLISLQSFRDKCEPVFLFSLNGRIISMVKGANAPLINAKVIQLVEDERKILAGEMSRPVLPELVLVDSDEGEDVVETPEVPVEDIYNVMIIRPSAVEEERVEEIKEMIVDFGAVIIGEEQRFLDDEQIRDFYDEDSNKFDFEEFVSYTTNNPSYILGICLGPPVKESEDEKKKDQSEEKESQPEEKEGQPEEIEDQAEGNEDQAEEGDQAEEEGDQSEEPKEKEEKKLKSIRELLKSQGLIEVCDLIDDAQKARKHLIQFFPYFAKAKNLQPLVERTLAVIRLDLLQGSIESVLELLQKEGFVAKMQKQLILTEEDAKTFYKQHKYYDHFPALIEHVSSAPILALCLERINAVFYWRYILGPTATDENPTSLRDTLGPENCRFNQIHGKDSLQDLNEEILFCFPYEHTVVLIRPHAFQDLRGGIIRKIQENGFVVSHLKEIQLTADKVEEIYRALEERDFFEDLLIHMTEGPCMAMIIGKENAVQDWRKLAGPTDPEEARKVAPESIRALFGKDILDNAVHASSTKEHALKTIELLFGDIDLDSEDHAI